MLHIRIFLLCILEKNGIMYVNGNRVVSFEPMGYCLYHRQALTQNVDAKNKNLFRYKGLKTMKLTAFRYGTTEITERMAFQDGNSDIKLPIALLFFLIEEQDKKILVDVGCDTMPGFKLSAFQKPVEVLEAYGVKRTEITDVIITHAHHDHIDAVRYYPKATVHIQTQEFALGKEYLKQSEHIALFDTHEVLSETIETVCIGGHSAGSCIVLLRKAPNTYVLCGDECYTKENFTTGKPTGSSGCLEKSRYFVETYGKAPFLPLIFHDPLLVPTLGYNVLWED